MAFRALLGLVVLIAFALPTGACCAPARAETATVEHSHHEGSDRREAASHSAAAMICVAFCAVAPVGAAIAEPVGISPFEAIEIARPLPESASSRPVAPPPRPV